MICILMLWMFLRNVSTGLLLSLNYTDRKVITNYLMDLTNNYVDEQKAGYLGFILSNSSRYDVVQDLIRDIHVKSDVKTLIINLNDTYNQEFSVRVNYLGYLLLQFIFTNTTNNVINIINRTENFNIYNTRSKMIIIIDDPIGVQELKEMFINLWSMKYLNIVVLQELNNDIITYTYNPYEYKLESSSNLSVDKLFYNKLKNFNGNVITFLLIREEDTAKARMMKYENGTKYYTGMEIEVFKMIAQYFNGTLIVKCVDDIIYKDGTTVNPWRQYNIEVDVRELQLAIIQKEKIDMIVSEELIISEHRKEVTMGVYPHSTDDMMILIKKADKVPYYLYILLIFTPETWGFFLITLIIGSITWVVIAKDSNEPFFNIIRMSTGGSLPGYSDRLPEKILIIFWLLYSLIITTAFVSNLATALMNEKYYDEIDTIDQLSKSDFILSVFKTQLIELKKAFNGTSKFDYINKTIISPDRFINRNATLNNYTSLLFDYATKHPIVANHERVAFVVMMKGVGQVIHIMKESPLPNYLAYKLPLKSPLYDDINFIIRKMVEAGLYIHWKRLQKHDYIISRVYEPDEFFVVDSKIRALSLNHFQGAFIILFIGLGISFVIFTFELIYNKIKRFLFNRKQF